MRRRLTSRAREEVAHLSTSRAVAADMRPGVENRCQKTLELHPEFVKGWKGQDLSDG